MMKLLLLVAFALVSSAWAVSMEEEKVIMPWFCLNRCPGDNFTRAFEQVETHRDIISTVSFEAYDLRDNSTLYRLSNEPDIHQKLHTLNLRLFPMITTVHLNYLRALFKNPMPFIKAAIEEAHRNNYDGYNLDFEPTTKATPEDAKSYAKFVDLMAKELHRYSLKLSVCVATWNTFWDQELLGRTAVDKVISMATYACRYATFKEQLDRAVREIPLAKIGIGFDSMDCKLETADIQTRFNDVMNANIKEIDMWKLTMEEAWIGPLENFYLHH